MIWAGSIVPICMYCNNIRDLPDDRNKKAAHGELMKKICEICNGSGQLSSFKGVSRFLLSWEECPECAGLGYLIALDGDSEAQAEKQDHDDNGKAKKNCRRGRT
ncbi:MAG: hypothetical protein KKA54_01995 [Proteobacteria bacterium]|nr:hypothetical protein [Pseudomonadota bacterium]